MPSRLRLYDVRRSPLWKTIGVDPDSAEFPEWVNQAQRRLLLAKESGDEGWWGTFAEMAFHVSRRHPYLTTPREVARLEAVAVRGQVVPVQNQFYEYLDFGNRRGVYDRFGCRSNGVAAQVYSRNIVPTFRDLKPGNSIRIYANDPQDICDHKRVLIQGLDATGQPLSQPDGVFMAAGAGITLTNPFSEFAEPLNAIIGIQKYVTRGQVRFTQVDPVTGLEESILTMEASEQVAGYRRYYFQRLPCAEKPVSVTAIAKLELIPVQLDSDYCLIQNLEAIIEECQAIRYDRMDSLASKQLSAAAHLKAIGFLNGELGHYLGLDRPAVSFRPFGSARLERHKVGMI